MKDSAAVINPRKRLLIPWLAYPLVMISGFFLYRITIDLGTEVQIASYFAAFFAALAITALEYSCPHLNTWRPEQKNVRADLMFMVSVQVALPTLLAVTLSAAAVNAINKTGSPLPSLWPHEAPVWIQVVLMLLVADFLRYWLHVAAHVYKPLWRLHAVHHSVDKLYWLNVGRFHPVEKTLQYLFDALPFVLIQVSPDVLGAYFVFYSINGFFQHSNVEMRFGWLNYIISSAELHRWHHSRITEESNSNYGNNLIVWDLIFGTRFLPEDRDISELGLVNTNYPAGFSEQMRTPCVAGLDKIDSPLPGWRTLILNTMIWLRIKRLNLTVWKPFVAAASKPEQVQKKLLQQILKTNETTAFGREHGFENIKNYEDYKQQVPIQDYESLRPYIDSQIANQSAQLTSDAPVMFSRTSGTTGKAKLIPILPASLESHKHAQKLFSVAQFEAEPSAYFGSALGIVSPAFEGTLENGMKYGSASGHAYKNMPGPARAKYVVPWQVFEISDYDLKYLVIIRLALARKDITHLASANPSTFMRLIELARENRRELIRDIKNQSFSRADELPSHIRGPVEKCMAVSPDRITELAQVLGTEDFLLRDIWPFLRMVTTWTGGSCAIAMAALRKQLPAEITVADPGYIASEFRGTITVEIARNLGCPAIIENFYEFVERGTWENCEADFRRLHELKEDREYYIFVTTQTGLYRYFINDIVRVNGRFEQTPTLQFIQKGKGTTNITGEKLTESQVLAAVQNGTTQQKADLRFFVMLADAETCRYRLLIESIGQINTETLGAAIESSLSEQNIEYREKRNSGRLKSLLVHTMRNGFYETYKKEQLEAGQREGQFKVLALQNQTEFGFDWARWSL